MLKNKIYLFLGSFLLCGLCLGASVGVYKRLEYNKQGYCYKTGAKLEEKEVAEKIFKNYFKNQRNDFGYSEYWRDDGYKSGRAVYPSKLFLLPGNFTDDDISRLAREAGDFSQAIPLPDFSDIDRLSSEILASKFVAFEYFDGSEEHTKRSVSLGLINKGWVSQDKNPSTYQRLIKSQDIGFFNKILGFGNYFYQHSIFLVDKDCCVPDRQPGVAVGTQEKTASMRDVFQRQRFFVVSNCGEVLMLDEDESVFLYLND